MNILDWAKKKREIEIACKHENPDRKEGEFDYGCACYEPALKAFERLCEDGHSDFSIKMSQANDAIGNPDIVNFFEKAQLKEIYEMRDNPNLVCHWYAVNNYTGKYIYEGECIGYGIPYSTSYTQPESFSSSTSSVVVPQADPNALYSNGVTASATWILSLDENGDVYPRYEEREIAVTQTKIPKRLCEEYSLHEDY